MATSCTDPSYRTQENERNAQAIATSHTNPAYRRQEQIADTNCENSTRQINPPEIRAQENERHAQAMATRCTDLSFRMQKNERNAQAMATSCANPAYRRQEQIADTNPRRSTRQINPPEIRAQENERNAQAMAASCTNPAYRRQEQIADTNQRRLAREQPFFYEMATKFDTSSCTYLYNQPCGLWNEEYCHGCGYNHLLRLSSSSFIKQKCCANGALSSVSCNFDKGMMLRFALEEMSLFMRMVTTTCKFCQDCTKYNNLLVMTATKVYNYCDNPGFTNQGPGIHCVMLSG
jgi:hypothetical protein